MSYLPYQSSLNTSFLKVAHAYKNTQKFIKNHFYQNLNYATETRLDPIHICILAQSYTNFCNIN